jgi:DNA-binding NtrC family response regulator
MKSSVVFVVDKNPTHRNLIKYNLESNKITRVQAFPSGDECLIQLKKNILPDFIITSYFSGSHSGFDFLRSVMEVSPSSGVIFFDTFEDPGLAEKLMDAGACDYVVKTGNPDAGISALLKNIRFLVREKAFAGEQ